MSVAATSGPRSRQRIVVVALVFVLLGLAGFANASIKRHRASSGTGPSAAVSAAVTRGAAISTAWYCAGPLPLGLRSEHSFVAIGNVSRRALYGELVVATETGVSKAEQLTIAPESSRAIRLSGPGGPKFGAATVLLDGAGAGVEEIVVGPTGSDASPCVSHATLTQYMAGGATKGAATLDLAVFDPGATPSVVSVSFSTAGGVVSPPAFQEVPVEAGETLVLDVARYLPLQPLLATTISATGGKVVAGAISVSGVGRVTFPSLVSASPVPEETWYFGPGPSGPGSEQGYVVLNPNEDAAQLSLTLNGPGGRAVLDGLVPPGGVVDLLPAPDKAVGAVRSATLSATGPVVVSRETVISVPSSHVAKAPAGSAKKSKTKKGRRATSSTTTTPTTDPPTISVAPPEFVSSAAGFSVTGGSSVLDASWLVEGGERNTTTGEYVAIANPGTRATAVRFVELGSQSPPPPLEIAAGESAVVDLGSGADPPGSVSLEVDADEPVVVGAGLYARGSSGSSGFSAPVAIPVD